MSGVAGSPVAGTRARAYACLALVAGWAAAPVALLAGAEASLVWLATAGALALAQLVLWRLGERALWQRVGLLGTVLQGLLAAGQSSAVTALALVLGTLTSALFALGALAEDGAGTALALRLPRTGTTPAARARRSLALALGLALVVLGLAPVFALLVDGASAAAARLDPRTQAEVTRTPTQVATPAESPGQRDPEADATDLASFPATLEWASSSPVEDDTPIVVLRWSGAPGIERPAAVHVRGRVLERFTETGLAPRSPGAALALDERRDARGWSELELARPAAREPEPAHEFEVEQIPLRIGARAESLLFTPLQPLALDCPGALLRGEAELVAPLPARDRLAFRVQSAARLFDDASVPAAGARLASLLALELPADSLELQTLRRLAREVTRGAADDRERVARVLAFFRREFVYEPKPTGIAGLAGLVHFVERRAGSCTHYAATAALMLRTLGLPTRVATGFLALPTGEDDVFVAALRNGHAWFEVAFEGLGWVTCDATPGGSANPAAALALAAGSAGGWSGIRGLFERFLDGRRLAWRELTGLVPFPRLTVVVLGALAALLGLLWLRGRRQPFLLELAPVAFAPAPTPALERLLRALAQAGCGRPLTRTLREHARELARLDAAGPPLEPLVEALNRMRYGGSSWSERDEEELTRVLGALANRSSR